MTYPSTRHKGFTLVETMVAISILMLAILGPLTIASSGLRNALYARDQVTAYYLAQEGIEYVRYVRDNNYIRKVNEGKDPGWLDTLDDDCFEGAGNDGCTIDTYEFFEGNNHISDCSNSSCTNGAIYMTVYPERGFYTHRQTSSSGEANARSPYTRVIRIEPVNGNFDKEVKVTSTITWRSGLGQKTFILTEYLSNIYKTL